MQIFEITPVAVGNPNSAEFNFAIKNQQQTISLAKYLKSIGINAEDFEEFEYEVAAANICIWADNIFIENLLKELSKGTHLLYFYLKKKVKTILKYLFTSKFSHEQSKRT